ncbi:zinc finger protein 485 [Anolis carolinensis]|uniref:zinc finger protein 485 n=1 Tax=Anolis carolinensis TaxID=28377 RepID=UPI002F2B716D
MAGAAGPLPQEPLTFEDVAIAFAPKEWAQLVGWQKALYHEVMRDNYETLRSLELVEHKPEILLRMERGEAPWAGGGQEAKGSEASTPDCLGLAQVQIKTESNLEENPAGLPCHAGDQKASKGSREGGTLGTLSPWPELNAGGVPALGQWPSQLWWPNGAMVGRQAAPVTFQARSAFWPTESAPEEMRLICTRCQKCFPARPAGVEGAAQLCPKCERGPTKAPPCSCAHCLPPRPRPPREERPYKCAKCERGFRFVHEYTWHQKVHAGEKSYKCGACQKVFRHKQELSWHQRAHAAEWPHQCAACQKHFRFKQELAWHLKSHAAERPYKCPECEKSFRFKQEFMWHQRAHVGDQPYKCPECEKSFRFKQEFTWHQRSHAGEKSYKCPGCDKSFRYKQEFVWHQRIHTGEQPYPCASCSATFTCRQEYMRHQRLHDGEKPYQCPHCEKTFRRGSTLIRHRRLHAGEGPLKCAHCERTFGQSTHLAKHQRMHALKGSSGEGAMAAVWGPCLPASGAALPPEGMNILSLKTVSVGALLLLNLQDPKVGKGPTGTAWQAPM